MKIAVCINFVPDTASKITLTSEGNLNLQGLSYIINPYDEFAIEEALITKEKLGGDTVAISFGSAQKAEGLRKALAMGIDSAILIKTDKYADSFTQAKILSEELKLQNCDIIFTGKQSVDLDNGISGQLISEFLNFNCITNVIKLEIKDELVTAIREVEGGKETVTTALPVVITANKGLNEPRYPALKGIMAAKKKTIEEVEAVIPELLYQPVGYLLPKSKEAVKILGNDVSAVPELVRVLKEDIKIL